MDEAGTKPTPERRAPLVVAVTGGIGAGKSAFCEYLARKPGARCLSADREAHALLERDPAVVDAVAEAFGARVRDSRGGIDRGRLAEVVFAEPDRLRILEGILHPRVRARLAAQVARLKADPATAIVLVEIPLLLEAGVPDWCDWVLALEAPRAARLARLAARGLAPEEARRRMALQAEDAARAVIADERIVNDGDRAALERRADRWWRGRGKAQERAWTRRSRD
ncbi:MAG: dephospho-CoA kinase [Candidatus Eisenbacteria bacterium]|uniref:Dephospho-CoA kinase n=1 Tax=Eiseniibacteriota bacterium TaxID=2212470 RepID=A0A937XBW7_UNCEI|nr:dephospho-CoA kinase [Candidatus Eisenbacteria bacterium]